MRRNAAPALRLCVRLWRMLRSGLSARHDRRMNSEFALFIAALAAAGLFAGFIGGLFGVGGGIVLVPALYALFTALGIDPHVRMHLAIGTSLSSIITTSWRSLSTHAKAGAVDWKILRRWIPWVALGA